MISSHRVSFGPGPGSAGVGNAKLASSAPIERATLPAAMAWQDSSTELAGSCSVTLLLAAIGGHAAHRVRHPRTPRLAIAVISVHNLVRVILRLALARYIHV